MAEIITKHSSTEIAIIHDAPVEIISKDEIKRKVDIYTQELAKLQALLDEADALGVKLKSEL